MRAKVPCQCWVSADGRGQWLACVQAHLWGSVSSHQHHHQPYPCITTVQKCTTSGPRCQAAKPSPLCVRWQTKLCGAVVCKLVCYVQPCCFRLRWYALPLMAHDRVSLLFNTCSVVLCSARHAPCQSCLMLLSRVDWFEVHVLPPLPRVTSSAVSPKRGGLVRVLCT